MRRSRFMINTQKETPKEAVVISHILMLRTCMIKQLTSGIYSYMPLALRSLRKIETIIREELDAAGCQELLMPMVQPADLWIESDRWSRYDDLLCRFKDRKGHDYCLGPTHEEVVTDIVRQEVRSYKDLPVNFYQIQTKFRDEIRPRFGLMRGREFIMKDAYSFDVDQEASAESYWAMHKAYSNIFARCGLEYRPVEADSGDIGGNFSHEFHVLAGSGEDLILSCNNCEYAANAERCELTEPAAYAPEGDVPAPVEVETPGKKTIEDLSAFLKVSPERCIKTLLFRADDDLVGAVLPGDRELNEVVIKNDRSAVVFEMVTDEATFQKAGLTPGFLGPVGWPEDIDLYVDQRVLAMDNAVAGANRVDVHFTGVVPATHFPKNINVTQLSVARTGDTCPRCDGGTFKEYRGIEVGHIFMLGCKYSEAMKATFLDADGKEQPMVMGCYGIGVGRTMAAAIEQNYDDNGIIWPVQIAPFHVMLLNLDIKDDQVNGAVESIYTGLRAAGVEVLVDDTAARPGPKFKDADLIGLPLQVTVGSRGLKGGQIELKERRTGEKKSIPLASAVDEVVSALKNMGWNTP
ncbi:MAG: proline--tRNA ligase [Acidobacteriota bacterium]|nr:proline--tRNA ligase [Acidobacteriota bacterium]